MKFKYDEKSDYSINRSLGKYLKKDNYDEKHCI